MNFESKKVALTILGVTSVLFSRGLFSLFNDPEGPNLLIVLGMAAIIYVLSWAAYAFVPSTAGFKKLLLVILFQILLVIGLYLCLR